VLFPFCPGTRDLLFDSQQAKAAAAANDANGIYASTTTSTLREDVGGSGP